MGKWVSDFFDAVGIDTGAAAAKAEAERARKLQEETNRLAREAAQAQANMQANFATDLSNTNAATVVAGGSADAIASVNDMAKKRKTSGLAANLGLNV